MKNAPIPQQSNGTVASNGHHHHHHPAISTYSNGNHHHNTTITAPPFSSSSSKKRNNNAYNYYNKAMIVLVVLALLLGCVSFYLQHQVAHHQDGSTGGYSRHHQLFPPNNNHNRRKMKKIDQAEKRIKKLSSAGKKQLQLRAGEKVNKVKVNYPQPNPKPKHKTGERDPCFVVYHIPKTGGISLGEYMKQISKLLQWKYTEWYSWYGKHGEADPYPFDATNEQYNYNYNKIHIGHMTPHFETKTHTQNCYKMTLLREPVDRAISAFYYHKHKTVEWKQCIKFNCRLWWEYIDDVTRRFAGHGAMAWNSYQVHKYRAGDVNGGIKGSVKPTAYEDARTFLDKFDFVCFLDDLTGCVKDMSLQIGIPNFDVNAGAKATKTIKRRPKSVFNPFVGRSATTIHKHKYHTNIGKKRLAQQNDMTDEIHEQIAIANKNDVQLYEWAIQKFGHSSSYTNNPEQEQ